MLPLGISDSRFSDTAGRVIIAAQTVPACPVPGLWPPPRRAGTESGGLAHRVRIVGIAGRQGPQGKHLAALMRTHRDAISDGMALQMRHRLVIYAIQCKMTVLGVGLNQTLTLKETAHTPGDGVGQSDEFIIRRCLDPAEPQGGSGTVHIDTVEEQHVKMDISCEVLRYVEYHIFTTLDLASLAARRI